MKIYTEQSSPPIVECTGVLNEVDAETIDGGLNKNIIKLKHANHWRHQLVWQNIIAIGLFHLGGIYGVYLMLTSARIYTGIFAWILYAVSIFGTTAGAHRLWSHRSYKAKLPLQIILLAFHTISFQYSVINWARDHRGHHKYSETDADPHNATRGFFFAHVGWLLCRKHPNVKAKGKGVDMSDLENDPLLRFQDKYYNILVVIASFILPTLIPMYLWGETAKNAWFIAVMLRWTVSSNITWSVNSIAHLYGDHPYDRFINPGENKKLAILTLGEGWHNYHHTFPWDYKASELGNFYTNFTTPAINIMAKIGWAYDLKSVSHEMVKQRVERTGDGPYQTVRHGDNGEEKMHFSNGNIKNTTH